VVFFCVCGGLGVRFGGSWVFKFGMGRAFKGGVALKVLRNYEEPPVYF
jgi:hypothetical protein